MKGKKYADFNLPNRKITPHENLNLNAEQKLKYIELCDDEMLYYDMFYDNGMDSYVVIAPPLTDNDLINFWQYVVLNNAGVSAASLKLDENADILTTADYTRLIIPANLFQSKPETSVSTKAMMDEIAASGAKNLIYTLQKNNKLEWIVDWAKWSVDKNGAEFVVIYDNGSTKYNISDIQTHLENAGIKNFVMSVPYKWGAPVEHGRPIPVKHKWLQKAGLEHIRMVCKSISEKENKEIVVLNLDIDEIVKSFDESLNIYDVVRKEDIDCIHFSRIPLYIRKKLEGREVGLRHHSLVDRNAKLIGPKYIFNAATMDMQVVINQHRLKGAGPKSVYCKNCIVFHCTALTTNWKKNRNGFRRKSEKFIEVDIHSDSSELYNLILQMERPFSKWGLDARTNTVL